MIGAPLLLLTLLPAFAKPMPAPNDVAAQERASACIFYYRLQIQSVPGGSAACEADGYGLEFMAQHGEDVAALERAHQVELDAQLARARAVAAAVRQREQIRPACTAMVLDGGAGPDGGAELCNLAGLSHDVITRIARHDAFVAHQQQEQRVRRIAVCVGVGALVLAVGLGLNRLVRRLRRGSP